ncbi:MAG: DsbA family protein [Proteobacteria bacterium]|nr:DsbA family protein [Pseudomonadota bacterium]
MPSPQDRHFIYFADPMCSWCYGFGPVLDAIAAHFEGRLPVRLVLGGLRAGNRQPMREKDRAYIRGAWASVSEASGQPFDLSFFERQSFTYDTEPACRAVVSMRRLKPGSEIAFLKRIASAFYAHNRDVTDDEVLADVAAEAGMSRASFLTELQSEASRTETFGDFLIAKQSGVDGFPLLAAGSQETGFALVCQGFRPVDGLIEAVEDWLQKGAPVTRRTS